MIDGPLLSHFAVNDEYFVCFVGVGEICFEF